MGGRGGVGRVGLGKWVGEIVSLGWIELHEKRKPAALNSVLFFGAKAALATAENATASTQAKDGTMTG